MKNFDEIFKEKPVIVFGEGYGGKIQAGAEDKKRGGKYSDTEKFAVFDILVGGQYWLNQPNVESICSTLGFECVPFIGNFTIDEAIWMVEGGYPSYFNKGIKKDIKMEGMIGRTSIPLFDTQHRRLIFKIKSCDF